MSVTSTHQSVFPSPYHQPFLDTCHSKLQNILQCDCSAGSFGVAMGIVKSAAIRSVSLTHCCPSLNCCRLIVQSKIAWLSLHLPENHFVHCRLHSCGTRPRHLLAMDQKCQLRISDGGTCGVTTGVDDVLHSYTLLLYVWCCIITFTIQAHVGRCTCWILVHVHQ